jgi:GTPase SAR1 family protein
MFLDGELIRLEIYDTAGQDEFATMRDQSLREVCSLL